MDRISGGVGGAEAKDKPAGADSSSETRSAGAKDDTVFEAFDIRSVPLTGIFLILAAATLDAAEDVVQPVVFAFLLSYLLVPILRSMSRVAGLSSGAAAGMLLGGLCLATGILLYLVSGPAMMWVERLPDSIEGLERRLASFRSSWAEVQEMTEQVERMASGASAKAPEVVVREEGLLQFLAVQTPSYLATGITILILLFFLLVNDDLFLRRLVRVVPRLEDKKKAVEIVRQIEDKISSYLLTTTAINVSLGASLGVGVWLLGMPSPLMWAVLATILNYIPYVGALAGAVLLGLASLLTFENPGYALLAPGYYILLNMIEGNLLTPWLLGRSLELNPVAIFLSLLFWGWLWGVSGALLAVPLLVVLKIIADRVEYLRPVSEFLAH